MRLSVSTELEIEASPERVWEVLTDTHSYEAWNPMWVDWRGDLRVGETIQFKVATGPVKLAISAEVEIVNAPLELQWTGPGTRWVRPVVQGTHYFHIVDLGFGRSKFIHGENFAGLLVPGQLPPIVNALAERYRALNYALKQRAETI